MVSLQNQIKTLRVQDKYGKQNFHEDMKKVFETVTKPIKDVFEDVKKPMKVTSEENNKAIADLKEKVVEVLNNTGVKTSCLVSLLLKITSPEHTSQLKLVKDSNSNRVNDLLIKNNTSHAVCQIVKLS